MNLQVYEKTRYQNIYRHKKNKNYIIMMSKPIKTSIATIDNQKIYKLEEAIKIRDNPKIKLIKSKSITYKDDFDSLWHKYIISCKYELKQSYNTYHKKEKIYNKHFKNKLKKPISKISKDHLIKFINNINTSDKQKNEIMKILKAFFNWCIKEEIIIINPMNTISYYKIPKPKMKFWLPNEISQFINYLNCIINSDNTNLKEIEVAYRTKIFVMLCFSLGDRIGETRALTFGDIDCSKNIITIRHSINYNPKSNDFVSNTKTYYSQRDINITNKLIDEIKNYKYFLINICDYNITDKTLIFFNHSKNRPISDVSLRKVFYRYCDKAKVPKIRMYDLRHTYVATMMAEGKELYLISERLGHSSYSTTVNKYGHLSNQVRKEIAEITDKYI